MRVERDPLVLRRDLTRGKVEAAEIRDPPGAVDNAIGLDQRILRERRPGFSLTPTAVTGVHNQRLAHEPVAY